MRPFAFKPQGNTLINPITLGQPEFYLRPKEGVLFTPVTAPLDNGDEIMTFERHDDSGYLSSALSGTNRAVYRTAGINGFPSLSWEGNVSAQGGYALAGAGDFTTFSFMHQAGSEWTLYCILKNIQNENTGTTKFLFSTANASGETGVQILFSNSGNNRIFRCDIVRGVSASMAVSLSHTLFDATVDVDAMVLSIRYQDPENTTDVSMRMYVNGAEVATGINSQTLSSAANSTRRFIFGNRNSGDLRFNGNLGDTLITSAYHTDEEHAGVVAYLMNEYGI